MCSDKGLSMNKMLESVKTEVYMHRRGACSSLFCGNHVGADCAVSLVMSKSCCFIIIFAP